MHDVSPEFIAKVRQLGYSDVTPEQMIRLAITMFRRITFRRRSQASKTSALMTLSESKPTAVEEPACNGKRATRV